MDAPSPNSVSNGYLPQARWARVCAASSRDPPAACSQLLAGLQVNISTRANSLWQGAQMKGHTLTVGSVGHLSDVRYPTHTP
jgi:hypothetical protein